MKGSMMRKNGWMATAGIIIMMMTVIAGAAVPKDEMDTTKSTITDTVKSTMEDTVQSTMTETSHPYAEMEKMKQPCRIPGMSGTLQSAEAVVGSQVQNAQGEKLGDVEQLILDNNNQAVTYVVIASGDRFYPVPWTAFDRGTETYILDMTADKLRQAPNVTSLNTSQFTGADLKLKSHDYYAAQIAAVQAKCMDQHAMSRMKDKAESMMGEEKQPNLCSSNDIIGYDIQDTQGKALGELDDIVFDVRQGNLAYGLISFGGIMGIGQKTAAVPWEAVMIMPGQEIAKLDTDEKTLQASVLPDGDIQGLSEPTFARQVHREFNQEPYWEVFGFVAPIGTESMTSSAWAPDSTYNSNFNIKTMETIQGTIKKVASFTPEKDAQEGLSLRVRTQDGRTMTVYAGPRQYYLQQKIRFQKGDAISLTGSRTSVNNRNVVLACQIKKGQDTFQLRDSQGKPLWQMPQGTQQMNQLQIPGTQQQMPAERDIPSR